jgi:hypothetical protein
MRIDIEEDDQSKGIPFFITKVIDTTTKDKTFTILCMNHKSTEMMQTPLENIVKDIIVVSINLRYLLESQMIAF